MTTQVSGVDVTFIIVSYMNACRLIFSMYSDTELENCHGIMQSIFMQSVMIGGLVAPNLTTRYVLLSPEQIASNGSSFVLSPWAWVIPITSLLMIIGVAYEDVILGTNEMGLLRSKKEVEREEAPKTETSTLLAARNLRRRSSIATIDQSLSSQYEINRRASVEAYGMINPCETKYEINLHEKLLQDKSDWEELAKLDAAMEEEDSFHLQS